MERGFLCGLADEHVARALVAMHADIAHRWTVAELARVAGMSRSMFAERFSRIVGVPPMGYLLRWRIAIAKDMLRRNTERLAKIGERTGYGSVSAFSTAFTRIVGCSPSAYQTETYPSGIAFNYPHRQPGCCLV
jgi:AraC-like DNA-binding protein